MDLKMSDKEWYCAHFKENNRDKDKSMYLILSLQDGVKYISDFPLTKELKHFNKGIL